MTFTATVAQFATLTLLVWRSSMLLIVRRRKMKPAAQISVKFGVKSLENSNWWTSLRTTLSMFRVLTKKYRQHVQGYRSDLLLGLMTPEKVWN
jgi:hypothetical protein